MLDKLRNASYALSMTFIWGAQPEGTRTWGQVHKYLCEANAQARRLHKAKLLKEE